MNGRVILIKNIVKKHLVDQYGDFTLVRLTGGYTNETFLLKGTTPPLVAKVASSLTPDIHNEINCLKKMTHTGIAPKVYDVFKERNVHITILEYREGQNGQSLLDHHDIDRTNDLYRFLGKTLSKDIHSQKYTFTSDGIRTCNLHELNINLDFVPKDLIRDSKEILEKLHDQQEDWVLTHGDYGMHNVLFTANNQLTVLDWEWSEWANPLIDIGWVCWFTHLHYPEHAKRLNALFLKEYQTHAKIDLSAEKVKGYCVYKVWKILMKVQHAPQQVQQEWIRRLKWTIETDII